MANASRDENLVTTLLGVSSSDGVTPVALYADPTTHRLLTSASGGAAPADATYVTLSTNATLTNERVLTGTANQITITDNGAGSTVVLSLPQSIATSSTPTFASMTLSAASSLTLGTASTNTGAIILKNSTNGNNTVIQAGAAGAALTFTLPTTDGANGEFLQTDGNGVMSWAAGASGANTALSNLASVAINTALLPDAAAADDFGSATLPFKDIFLAGSSGTPGTNNFRLTGASTSGTRVISLPDATDTLMGKATTDTMTNKTFDTAGAGNSFSINGTAITAVTGTGSAVLATSPSLTTPAIGAATGTSLVLTGNLSAEDLLIEDSDASHYLTITTTSNLTATRTLTLVPGDADRTVTLAGNLNISGDLITSGDDSVTLTTSAATNVTLPTTGTLATLAGTEELDNKTLDSSVGKGTWTASGTWTLPAVTAGGTVTLAENSSIALDPAGSADGKYTGITIAGTAGATLAFGDLIYLDPTDSRWELADANAAAAADGDARGVLGICVLAAANDGDPTTILLHGVVRADTAFPALTINAPVYVSETAGDVVVTQPTTSGVVIRVCGFALTADEIFFNPSSDYITHA